MSDSYVINFYFILEIHIQLVKLPMQFFIFQNSDFITYISNHYIIENKLDILRFDSHIISDIKDMYIADMQKYVKNSFETVKIEKVYKNIPSQLAKDNKNFKYNFVSSSGLILSLFT